MERWFSSQETSRMHASWRSTGCYDGHDDKSQLSIIFRIDIADTSHGNLWLDILSTNKTIEQDTACFHQIF